MITLYATVLTIWTCTTINNKEICTNNETTEIQQMVEIYDKKTNILNYYISDLEK